MKRGEVYRYGYLWSHEKRKGQESGSKIRRVCLLMQQGEWLFLFPLSHQVPRPLREGTERVYEVVPEMECRRIGLPAGEISHLILDEYNKVRADELFDFEGLEPVGSLSLKFLEKAARRLQEAMTDRKPVVGVMRR